MHGNCYKPEGFAANRHIPAACKNPGPTKTVGAGVFCCYQRPITFHQRLPAESQIARLTTVIMAPFRHQVAWSI